MGQISALRSYRQSVVNLANMQQEILQLEKQLQVQAPNSDPKKLSRIKAKLDDLKAKYDRGLSALRRAEGRNSLQNLINLVRNQLEGNFTGNNNIGYDAKKQTNVLDSSENHGILEIGASSDGDSTQNANAVKPVGVKLKLMEKWTQEQREQAVMRVKQLSEIETVKTDVVRPNKSSRKEYVEVYGKDSIPESYDVDHIVDIQLGGDPNSIDNLQVLDRSVNRSLGAQIMHAIKDYPPGTAFGTFTIE